MQQQAPTPPFPAPLSSHTPETLLSIHSFSKLTGAITLTQLVDTGLATLDDLHFEPIRKNSRNIPPQTRSSNPTNCKHPK
ncbi:hypothetical protein DPSP01_013389 [Paraphaeosphaeria sporulosa]